MELWRLKAKSAGGRPFEAYYDLKVAALDIILAAAFGIPSEECVTREHVTSLQISPPTSGQGRADDVFPFPEQPLSPVFQSIVNVTATIQVTMTTPLPHFHVWLLRTFTKLGQDFMFKDQFVRRRFRSRWRGCLAHHPAAALRSGLPWTIWCFARCGPQRGRSGRRRLPRGGCTTR